MTTRVEANRTQGRKQCLGNVVGHALAKTFEIDGYKAAYESCLTSPRFGTLLALAGHSDQFDRLVIAAAKVANNPATKANL